MTDVPDPAAPVRVLVLHWAVVGLADDLAALEDSLVAIAGHHATSVTRERAVRLRDITEGPPPDEVHLLEFPDEAAFDAYLADSDRARHVDDLQRVLDRSVVLRLVPLP